MKNFNVISKITVFAAAIAATVPMLVQAESATVSGPGPLTTNARLDFRVTVPKVLFLRVGTGVGFGLPANTTIDLIDFVVPAANVGDGSIISATVASGDLGTGAVTALLRSNAGQVTLTANTVGALNNGAAGDTIPWSQIAVASAILPATGANTLPHTVPLPAAGASANFASAPAGKITDFSSKWTYTYLNAAIVPAGTYGGVGVNNGRVTYTASVL